MAGMLPGVELARRRKIHHHGGGGDLDPLFSSRRSTPAGARAEQLRSPTSMGEEALRARRRLEKKLRGFGIGSEPAVPPPPALRYAPPPRDAAAVSRSPPHTRRGAPPARGSAAATSTPALERTESSESECAVCLDGLRGGDRRPVLNLPCSHRYHWDCVRLWIAAHPNCPCCRTPVASS